MNLTDSKIKALRDQLKSVQCKYSTIGGKLGEYFVCRLALKNKKLKSAVQNKPNLLFVNNKEEGNNVELSSIQPVLCPSHTPSFMEELDALQVNYSDKHRDIECVFYEALDKIERKLVILNNSFTRQRRPKPRNVSSVYKNHLKKVIDYSISKRNTSSIM